MDTSFYVADLSWVRRACWWHKGPPGTGVEGGRWKLMASMASKGRMVIGFTVCCNTSMMTQANMAVGI